MTLQGSFRRDRAKVQQAVRATAHQSFGLPVQRPDQLIFISC